MRRKLRRTNARQGLFLEFDHLILPLALGLPLVAERTVSGILFRPSVHYAPDARARPAERLRTWQKDLLYRLMLRHPMLRRVHTLDDAFPDFAWARYGYGAKVTALPDPVHPPVKPADTDRDLVRRAPDGRVLFVLFGVLSERKGVLSLLRALATLDAAKAGRIAVLIAGEVDPPIRTDVEDLRADVAARQPSLWLHLEPRHLSAGEIAALVDGADVVLAPYQRFVGSSGVLMWAAGQGRPVITQDYGLLGRLVREHGLGLAIDTTNTADLARTIMQAADSPAGGIARPDQMAAFAADRTAAAFAACIVDPLVADMSPAPVRQAPVPLSVSGVGPRKARRAVTK